MIRRQCVKLKAQTHLNMPIVYAQSYGYHYKNTFSYFILRLLLSLIFTNTHVNTMVVLYMINIRPSSPPPPLAFSFIILFRSSSIFFRASSRAFAASDFSFGFLFDGVFLETVLLFFTGSGFLTTQLAFLSSPSPSNLLWICSTWMLTMSQKPARS